MPLYELKNKTLRGESFSALPLFLLFYSYLCNMKVKIDWKRVALLAFVAILLLYITKSFFMSLGIMMILLLIDALLAQWEDNRKNKDRFK